MHDKAQMAINPSRSNVFSAMETMDSSIENLFDAISLLTEKVSPVLLPDDTSESTDRTPTGDQFHGSVLHDNLANKIQKIERAINLIRVLNGRIDL